MDLIQKIKRLTIIRQLVIGIKKMKLPWLQGLSLYDLLKLYLVGIVQDALSYRAAAIAFSFFMALFPFALFILNLIPYIPIDNFQVDFLVFVQNGVPPKTYDAIAKIIADILINSHSGLLSTGFIMSIFLMTNGVNAIFGGFENSKYITIKRGFFRQYFISLAMSVILSLILLFTVATIIIFEVFIQKTKLQDILSEDIPLIKLGRYIFLIAMILCTTSLLFKFGTKRQQKNSFISIGSVFTTILIILSSYFFGIWVLKFSRYNELYGSIGTLLIVMFYIWINCMILLLGFDLNAAIYKLRKEKLEKLETKQ